MLVLVLVPLRRTGPIQNGAIASALPRLGMGGGGGALSAPLVRALQDAGILISTKARSRARPCGLPSESYGSPLTRRGVAGAPRAPHGAY
jgi:hypothetical protein